MNEKLLTISEAAKLLDVCENTLRDWDIEKKLVATRTEGGHRRYSLDQIRDHLEKNTTFSKPIHKKYKELQLDKGENDPAYERIIKQWEGIGYLDDVNKEDKGVVAILLENARLTMENSFGDPPLSTEQLLYITKYGWLRCRFKKMVAVQPMLGPASLTFKLGTHYSPTNGNSVSMDSEAVAAKSYCFESFAIFADADFETVKDLYADSIARELEALIVSHLENSNIDIAKLDGSDSMKGSIDYVIAPQETINEIKEKTIFEGIDMYPISVTLDTETLFPIQVMGKYPKSKFETPIFSPYVLANPIAPTRTENKKVITRYGWVLK